MLKWFWCLLLGHKWKYQYATYAAPLKSVDQYHFKRQYRLLAQGSTTSLYLCSCCGKSREFTTVGRSTNLKEEFVRAIMDS